MAIKDGYLQTELAKYLHLSVVSISKIYKNCPFLNKYVLVGGSALSLHMCHRKSEDLDFFTYLR